MKKRYVLLYFTALALNCGETFGQPSINYQPRSQTVILYQLAAFGVIASGTAPLSYQWRQDAMPIAGATNDQIVLVHPQFSDAGQYSVVVSNAEGSLTSGDAELTVNPPKGGDLDYSFIWGASRTDSEILSVAVQSDGRVLIGGNFSTVSGVYRSCIARLNKDGTLDTTFQNGLSGANCCVSSIAVQIDRKVIIGGGFTSVNGVSRTNVARLNADGTLDTGFQNGLSGVGGLNSYVTSVAVQSDGKVLIGGGFTTVNGVSRKGIARLNGDGTLDTGFQNGLSGVNDRVLSVAVQWDGKVVIGGNFTAVDGVNRNGIARLNADGTLDTGFDGRSLGDAARSVALQSDGKVLLLSDGVIVRLNADGTLDTGFEIIQTGDRDDVTSIAVQSDGKVLIGGYFTSVNGVQTMGFARLNPDGTLDTGFGNGLGGVPWQLSAVRLVAAQSDGKVLIGGLRGIARLNADGTLDSSFQSGFLGADGPVSSVAVQSDGKLIIIGRFSSVNYVSRSLIARLNADGSLDTGLQNGPFGALAWCECERVGSLAMQSDGKVIIGGFGGIARLNTDGTLDSGFQDGLSGVRGSVYSVAVQSDGKVLIGGGFTTVNGVPTANIARLWGSADIPPQIKSVNRNGAEVNLNWYAISNRTYRVQYNGNLSAKDWTDLAGDVSATGTTASKTDTIAGGASQRFYRVLLLP